MITDQQTNTVYFSNTLPEEFPDEFQQLFIRIISETHQETPLGTCV
jgi:hypothetical protein